MSYKKIITDEQNEIVGSIMDYNVLVNAVAGSGKTTTILFMANAYPERSFLLITYTFSFSGYLLIEAKPSDLYIMQN